MYSSFTFLLLWNFYPSKCVVTFRLQPPNVIILIIILIILIIHAWISKWSEAGVIHYSEAMHRNRFAVRGSKQIRTNLASSTFTFTAIRRLDRIKTNLANIFLLPLSLSENWSKLEPIWQIFQLYFHFLCNIEVGWKEEESGCQSSVWVWPTLQSTFTHFHLHLHHHQHK